MILTFNPTHLKNRNRTEIKDLDNNLLYWSIYDFSYKYRTRIYDGNDIEVAYVEKIVAQDNTVRCVDLKDNKEINLIKTDNGYKYGDYDYIGDVDKGHIEGIMELEDSQIEISDENNLIMYMMLMFALVEAERE